MTDTSKILIVDDEYDLLELLDFVLEQSGYRVLRAMNGKEAIEMVEREEPDLVISDIAMPVMDGYSFCRRVRENPRFAALPFFFLTARNQLTDKIDGFKFGADDYLSKPFEPDELLARVESILRRKNRYDQLISRDGMTELYNHKYFQDLLRKELARALERNLPLSLALVDVDFFKKINDGYGHPAGDAVLKSLAGILKDGVRKRDSVARYGGEEFAILMPETPPELAAGLLDALREEISRTPFYPGAQGTSPDGGGDSLPVTISAGVAAAPHHAMSGESLIAHADRSLYQSKQSGRNRVTLYHPE